MKLSAVGLAFIAKEEGFVGHVYLDQIGVPTIGYGHVVGPGERFPATITEAEASALLARDVAAVEAGVALLVTVPLTQSMFDGLVSLAFNIGLGAFRSSTLRARLNSGDYASAARQFSAWRMGGGKVLPVLVGRRYRESALFVSEGLDVHRDVNPSNVPDMRDPDLSETNFGSDDDPKT